MFWPLILTGLGDRSVPVVILNGRMSARSATHWRRARMFSNQVFGNIDLCLAQSERDAALFSRLGVVSASSTGNLKFDRDPPPVESTVLDATKAAIGERPVWIAASTHPGEEALAVDAHIAVLERAPDSLLIIAPRHPQRGGQNPVEPAQLGIPVLHGPNVRNFKGIYKDLNDIMGALRCETEIDFKHAVGALLFDAENACRLHETPKPTCPVSAAR